jgi:nitroimidazol reductase NimA-like FMN-containing flavoprotein (pyridoxamine 5'-phosphate oxidase superfamily)
VRRMPKRAAYEREAIDAILDEALICHVGFVDDGLPVVTPTLHARVGDELLLHGSSASRTLRRLAEGADVCVTVTLTDGLVLARSAFHHSVNYRSVMLFGRAEPITGAEAKRSALEAFTEKLVAGRWADVRPPTEIELKGTAVVRLPIEEASAKLREGQPLDDEADYSLDVWAGVVPLAVTAAEPIPDPRLAPGTELPPYLPPRS